MFGTDLNLTIYLGLVVLVNRIVAGLFTPAIEALKIDKVWLMYMSWVAAAFIIFSTGLNLFAAIIDAPLIGQLLTAVSVGGGANILHDVSHVAPDNPINKNGQTWGLTDSTDK